jgi:hypothetical protein
MGNTTDANSSTDSKLSKAFAAAAQFVEDYESSEYAGGERWLQIVWYDNNAKTQLSHWMNVANSLNLADATDLKDALDVKKVLLKTASLNQSDIDGDRLGTNTEAGLQLAYNLYGDDYIEDVPLANRYTILLTDGATSDGIRYENERDNTDVIRGYSQWEINNGGWTAIATAADSNVATYNGAGSPNADQKRVAFQAAADLVYKDVGGTKSGVAVRLQNRSTIFSIGYEISNEYTGGTGVAITTPVSEWLSNFSTTLPDDNQSLLERFRSVLQSMLMKTEPWIVTDPMGDKILFLESVSPSDGVTFDTDDEDNTVLYWDLSKATHTSIDNTGLKTYTYQYSIKLNNLADGFKTDTGYLTNGQTTLAYRFAKYDVDIFTGYIDENDQPADEEFRLINFYVPKVLGYAVDLSFLKVAAYNNSVVIPGAQFLLTRSDGNGLPPATSKDSGLVTFEKVPSGFAYTLSETIANANYNLSAETVNIKIEYGVIYYQPDGEDGAWEPFPCVNAGYYKFENELNSKPETLYVQKRWVPTNEAPNDGSEITVELIQYKHIGNEKTQVDGFDKTVTLSAANRWLESIEVPTVDASTGYTYSYGVKEVDSPTGYTEIQHPTEYAIEEVDSNSEGKEKVFILTNKSDATTSINVEKEWIVPDGYNKPDEVTVSIARYKYNSSGEPLPDQSFVSEYSPNPLTITLKSEDGYSGIFSNLPLYDDDGNTYYYNVTETVPPDSPYAPESAEILIETVKNSSGVSGTAKFRNVTNQYEIPLSITKNWVDDDNDAGFRPTEVVFELWDSVNGMLKDDIILNETNGWSYNSKDDNLLFPVYNFKEENNTVVSVEKIIYEFKETGVNKDTYAVSEGFESTEGQFTVTNTYKGKVYISVNKVWEGNMPPEGYPDITLRLWQNGVEVKDEAVTLSDGTTSHTFTGQEKLDPSGIPYEYVVTEDPVTGWYVREPNDVDTDANGNITVTLTNNEVQNSDEYTAVSGTKIWRQPSNVGKRDITVGLERSYTTGGGIVTSAYGSPITLSAHNELAHNWQYSFESLPKYADAEKTELYNYKVIETGVQGSYNVKPDDGDHNIINTITGTEVITVDKSWIWPGNVAKPDVEIEVYRTATGDSPALAYSGTLKSGEPGISFTLPKYDDDGRLYIYSVREAEGNFTGRSTDTDDNPYSFSFENTIKQEYLELRGTKNWGHPEGTVSPEITLNLYQNGELQPVPITLTSSADRATSRLFSNPNRQDGRWPKYDANGQLYIYTVEESGVPSGYTSHQGADGLTINNIIKQSEQSVNVNGVKIWAKPDSMPAPDITVNLIRAIKGQQGSGTIIGSKVLRGGETSYDEEYIWTGLPKYDPATGGEYIYSVSEDYVEGFTSAVGEEAGENFDKYDIVNTVAQETISINVNKLWRDYTDAELPAPVDSVMVELLRGGSPTGLQRELSAANGWTGSFDGLDKYNLENGHEYAYEIRELTELENFNTNVGELTATEIDGVYSVDVKNVKKEYQYQVIRDYIVRDEGGRVIYHSDPQIYEDLITVPTPQTVTVDGSVSTRTVFNGSGQTLTYTFLKANSTESVTITEEDFGTIKYMYLYYEYTMSGGGGWTPPPPPQREEEIEEEDPPLAEVIPPAPDDEVVLFEEETPLADLPQTGANVPAGDRGGATQGIGGASAILPAKNHRNGGNRGAAV